MKKSRIHFKLSASHWLTCHHPHWDLCITTWNYIM